MKKHYNELDLYLANLGDGISLGLLKSRHDFRRYLKRYKQLREMRDMTCNKKRK